jgi:tight adherence protein B
VDSSVLLIVGVATLGCFGVLLYLLFSSPISSKVNRLRGAAISTEGLTSSTLGSGVRSFKEAVSDIEEVKGDEAVKSIKKRLQYAQLNISPMIFHVVEVSLSLFAFAIAFKFLSIPMQIAALLTGPLFCRWLLNLLVDKRYKAFDRDYPAFLLSLVGLLKTGMNPMQAMESAANGLEEGSLLRFEVEAMLERLRLGVPEDKSIGSFGENIFHPEIELFVQALLLSRKVGGTLSDTLERLAKQVRRRQQFRATAQAAVGLQRGSILFILAILVGLLAYIGFMVPDFLKSLTTDVGFLVVQSCILTVFLGIYWIRQVTKLKI